MTTLICSGTLFSNWQHTLTECVSINSPEPKAHTDISVLAKEICQQQFPESNELKWSPFTPDDKYIKTVGQVLTTVKDEPIFTWADCNSSLYLNFWNVAVEEAKFVLFYSSPEFELSNYIRNHSFSFSKLKSIINAWIVRTQAMLTFFMNNRDKCLLVSFQSTTSSSDSFIQVLNKKFDLELQPNYSAKTLGNTESALIEYLSTSLLSNNQQISELYDEVRSAATVISDQDKSISVIKEENSSLINAFLTEASNYKQLKETQPELEDELSLIHLQISQMQMDLEYHQEKCFSLEENSTTMADYLSTNPLLKVARQARKM